MAPGNGREPADVVVFNAGNNQMIDFREVTAQLFEDFWRVGCFAGFLVGREAARRLVPLGRGTVIFTGASGSLRGKAGLRPVRGRQGGPAHDLAEHGARVRRQGPARRPRGDRRRHQRPAPASAAGRSSLQERGEDGLLGVDAIAETYWQIHRQPRSAWTQEVDLRPFKENF